QPTPSSAPAPNRQAATERRAAAGRKPAGAATPTAKPRASGRVTPAAVKRHVWRRDGGRCTYVDRQTGRRCNSRHLIEMDHILPYALGGSSDPENVRLLCGVHHRHRHAPHGSRRTPEG
ncbi:MAG: HNH endonuclease signature motif containing protein, partial [Spirochaetaceae bacterium]|nr:HNH endonuclease signature motif containing protein [Spirochaetaceae bacterium]